jgi:hypothetical protein
MAEEILLNVALSQDLLPKGKRDLPVIVRLDIEPGLEYRQQHESVPADICLLLDSSTSMIEALSLGDAQRKRDVAIAAARQILPHLGPEDKFSIIFYDSQAHLIAERWTRERAEEADQVLGTAEGYGGSTNFEAALRMAQQVLARGQNSSRRVFFLTDGNANRGNPVAVGELVNRLAADGVTIDCLGVGTDFNFAYMRQLSAPSNGLTERIETGDHAKRLFQQILASAQSAVATNVFLTLQFAPGLRDLEVYQCAPEVRYYPLQPGAGGRFGIEIPVRTVQRDRRNIYLIKAHLDTPIDSSQHRIADVRVDYDLPPAGLTGQRAVLKIAVNCRDQGRPVRDTDVDNLFAEAELAKYYERFLAVHAQDWEEACVIIDEMIRRAQIIDDQDRQRHFAEIREKLVKDHRLSEDDLNRIGSRSTKVTRVTEVSMLGDPDRKTSMGLDSYSNGRRKGS